MQVNPGSETHGQEDCCIASFSSNGLSFVTLQAETALGNLFEKKREKKKRSKGKEKKKKRGKKRGSSSSNSKKYLKIQLLDEHLHELNAI